MYEFRTKLRHNMTLCQGLLPADFELNHLAKWVLSGGEKKLFEIILMENWDLCAALLLMISCFAWLVIKPSHLPIMRLEVFHLWSQMDFFKTDTSSFYSVHLFCFSFFSPLSLLFFLCAGVCLRVIAFVCGRVPSAFHPSIFLRKYDYDLNYKLDIFAT